MRKLQESLIQLFSQYEYVKKIMPFELIMLYIYPIYRVLCLFRFDFMTDIYQFSTLFLLLFVIGVIFSFADNKLKEMILAMGVLVIVSVVNILKGHFDNVVYTVIYGFIVYNIFRLMNDSVNVKGTFVCSKCGAVIPRGVAFCTSCGCKAENTVQSNEGQENVCPNCGKVLKKGAVFCASCGSKLKE